MANETSTFGIETVSGQSNLLWGSKSFPFHFTSRWENELRAIFIFIF
jgi:hypothetical protein